MKRAFRLALLLLTLLGAYVSVTAPAMADGNPIPCSPNHRFC
jgi:hypothetical protein